MPPLTVELLLLLGGEGRAQTLAAEGEVVADRFDDDVLAARTVSVESGLTVRVLVVWPLLTGNDSESFTGIDSCLCAACGVLPFLV